MARLGAAISLVDRPEGIAVRCVYDVEFSVLGSTAEKLVLVSGSPALVSATAVSVTANYVTSRQSAFSPTAATLVANFDENHTAITIFANNPSG